MTSVEIPVLGGNRVIVPLPAIAEAEKPQTPTKKL
jgi:hypothetical protein